jgi:HK97 family phage portal protein
VGLLDTLLGRAEPTTVVTPVTSSAGLLEARLAAITAARADAASMTVERALTIPAVRRGCSLIASMVGQFVPEAWRDGLPMIDQPAVIRRPDPRLTRADWLAQVTWSLLTTGNAYLWRAASDFDGWPTEVRVLDPGEVIVSWDSRRTDPVYTWRGRDLTIGRELWHVAIDRRPGQLLGESPLAAGLGALAAIAAAESFAADWYASSGIPSVVLKTAANLSGDEAERIKTRWMDAHRGPAPEPAVLGGGLDADFPTVDPQRAQLLESREHGARVVARLLGIPAALLLIDQHGSAITYSNVSTLLTELVRGTIAPLYLVPIEQTMGDLLPRTQTVRFALGELQRSQVAERFAVYQVGIASGVLTPDEVRAWEGLAPNGAPAPAVKEQGATPT